MSITFVAIKPDGVQRQLIGPIISRFERLHFRLRALKMLRVSPELAAEHYAEHQGKPFFADLVEFITSGDIVAMAWEGPDAIEITRKIVGATNPVQAAVGTIRGDFGTVLEQNVIHASDSAASAQRELKLFFPELSLA